MGGGGGDTTPVYYNGNLYVRGILDMTLGNKVLLALSAATGQQSTAFHDTDFTYSNRESAPAFSNGRGYIADFGHNVLEEFDPLSGAVGWTKSLTGDSFASNPIIINGDVFEGISSGKVEEFDGVTGNLIGSINVGNAINMPGGFGGSGFITAFGAGERGNHELFTRPRARYVRIVLSAGANSSTPMRRRIEGSGKLQCGYSAVVR
jgi:outer membrane protein assembly factor BamB